MNVRSCIILLCCLLSACGSDSGGNNAPISPSGPNVLSVSIAASNICTIVNEPCTDITICRAGTSTCQTVSDILVDYGSVGLRVFASVLSSPLTPALDPQGRQVGECAFFADGRTMWGSVRIADVRLAGEPSVQTPIQVIDATFAGQSAAQNPCNSTVDSDPQAVRFNGILGIGVFREDCGPVCAVNANNNLYFSCAASSCSSVAVPLAGQLQHPVWMLPSDNNGLALALPNVSANGAPSVSGSLIIGVGTSTNNTPPAGLSVLTTDQNGLLITIYKGKTIAQSIIDSGSNAYFFPDVTIQSCAMPLAAFYCPPNPLNLSATLMGANGVQAIVPFQVANTENLVQTGNAVFNNVAGSSSIFDWGLPFLLGRTVYVGIEGQSTILGTGPFFAF